MMTNTRPLGIMKPLGGGDPIPLKKTELVLGRRPTCDIRLDFENVSGKHCQLRYIKGVWHVRDLNSTNGTTVNGQKISSEHGLMPDDELGVAGHYYTIDYDPVAPSSLIDANLILEEELSEAPRHRSLMELAGLSNDESPYRGPMPQVPTAPVTRRGSQSSAPESPPSHDEVEKPRPSAPKPSTPAASDEDFFDMIRDDVEEDDHKPRKRR